MHDAERGHGVPTVLVVEDDQKIALALSLRLKQAGYRALTAYDGVQAMSLAVKEKPDVVILDIALPAGGGFRVAHRLQSNPETMGVPVIFMTASKRPDLRDLAHELGGAAFFEKPYDSQELLDTVADLLAAVA